MLKTMEPQAFDVELQSGGEPLLVAFLKRNDRFRSQYKALDEASGQYSGKLRCFLYDTDYLDVAMNRFRVKGTPTFLLFSKGREVDRLIGESDRATLEDFISSALGGH